MSSPQANRPLLQTSILNCQLLIEKKINHIREENAAGRSSLSLIIHQLTKVRAAAQTYSFPVCKAEEEVHEYNTLAYRRCGIDGMLTPQISP